MGMKTLLLPVFFLSVLAFLAVPAYAVDTVVEVGEQMDWEVSSFSVGDVTYPDTVYFVLQFKNKGSSDLNASGNMSIRKGGSLVYTGKVFEGNVSAQQTRNFSFNWNPTDTGDFLANVTVNVTNNKLNQTNLTFAVTSFTVYSAPSGPSYRPPSGSSAVVPSVIITKTWDEIPADTSVAVRIDNNLFSFTEIMIEVDRDSSGARVDVNRLFEMPSYVGKDPEGKVYQYIEINHENLEGNIRNVVVVFRVENGWITENNIDKSGVTLNRYSGALEEWEVLPTMLINEDSDYAYYGSEVPGLSVFSVTGKEKTLCSPNERKCEGNESWTCLEDGSGWVRTETCEYGCSGGACVIPATCTPGERRCEGKELWICLEDGSGWVRTETCEYDCWGSECKGMYVSYITRMAVFVLFAILTAIILIMVALVYMNMRTFMARKG
jgi:PGF-pre-PGF domain-containing protein